jgi:hypothetical protein
MDLGESPPTHGDERDLSPHEVHVPFERYTSR